MAAGMREFTHTGPRGWVDRYAGFCPPAPLPAKEWRPSIYERRCRRPPAAYPDTRASSPRSCPVWPCSGWGLPSLPGHPGSWWSLTPPFHPYLLSACAGTSRRRRSIFCGTGLRVTPSGRYPPPCSAEPGRSSSHSRGARPPSQPIRPTVYRRRAPTHFQTALPDCADPTSGGCTTGNTANIDRC
jgi:hypothetical protein